jgi:ribonuclease HI
MVRGTGPTAPTRSDTADVQREVILFADGCCLPETRVGGWACVQTDPTGCTWHCRADSHPRTTNNRMELEAAIAALRALEEPCRVRLFLDSQYVQRGITEWLPEWKSRDWRGRDGRRIKHRRAWQRLDRQLQRHHVTCQWIRGHAGHEGNELADQLARQAATERRELITTLPRRPFHA